MSPASPSPDDRPTAPTGAGRLPAGLQWCLVGCLSIVTTVPLEVAGFPAGLFLTLVGITCQVEVLTTDSIERTLVGKARRVIDQRAR